MSLAETAAVPTVDLADYSEPRLTPDERTLLDAVRWAHGKHAQPPTVADIALEADRRLDRYLLADLAALEQDGMIYAARPASYAPRRVQLTDAGRMGLALADVAPAECPRCGLDVLVVDVGGRAQALEPGEVLAEFPCPLLAASRYTSAAGLQMVAEHSGHCSRCDGSGTVGEALPRRGVAVDAFGLARRFRVLDGRVAGEAVYVPHSCIRR
jgi:hypothetical protein